MHQFKVGDKVKFADSGHVTETPTFKVCAVNRYANLVSIGSDNHVHTCWIHSDYLVLDKKPEDDLEEQKQNVLANLDYCRVEKAMKALDWGWYPSMKVPTKEQHVNMLNSLIDEVIKAYRKDKSSTYTGSGGWVVRIYKDEEVPILSVAFEVDQTDGKYVQIKAINESEE